MFNKYLDLHFSYNFYRTKVRSLSCQYHSLTKYLNDEEVYSVLSGLSFSKDRMEVLNLCWKWSFINNFETEIKLKSTYRAPPLNLIFLMILKLEQAQRRIFCILGPQLQGFCSLTNLTEVLGVCKNEKYDENKMSPWIPILRHVA